jgi:hypothetical protein
VSDWAYVAIAYTVVWGSLAVYAVMLARRVAQGREVARTLRESTDATDDQAIEQDNAACDGQSVP